MTKGNYLNSVEAANLLGVNVSTIKRWTDRGKLNCLQTPGGHRKFLMKHINEYLKDHSKHGKDVTILPYDSSEHRQLNHLIQKHKIDELKEYLLKYSLVAKYKEVNMIISGLALGQYPIYKIFDELITPVLREVGHQWETNEICVAEEHIASGIIRDAIMILREVIVKEQKNAQSKVFCFALDDDQHDIPLKMVQVILEQRGFEVYFSGQQTPARTIEKFIEKYMPDRVYVSCTYYNDDWTDLILEVKHSEMQKLYYLSNKYNFELYIGGQAFEKLIYNKNKIKRRLYTFEDVYKY